MYRRVLFIVVLLGGVWSALVDFSAAQEIVTPTPPIVEPTPTIDRLAPPPTAESPTQADEGAYFYWLNCQPCHGDQGQGLTDEWRAQYPAEDQNCWLSGCHGKQPYENGFTVPTVVPPVTGENSLGRFETMGQVYDFIRAAMPYQAPGSLSDEEYLAITAFLARAHGLWDGATLNATTIEQFRVSSRIRSTDNESTAEPEPAIEEEDNQAPTSPGAANTGRFVWGIVVIVLLFLGVWAWRRYGQ